MSKNNTMKDSFQVNYEILLKNAERLREEKELDIDSLVPLVEESTRAYQACKQRIDAVRAALAAHLGEGDEEPAS